MKWAPRARLALKVHKAHRVRLDRMVRVFRLLVPLRLSTTYQLTVALVICTSCKQTVMATFGMALCGPTLVKFRAHKAHRVHPAHKARSVLLVRKVPLVLRGHKAHKVFLVRKESKDFLGPLALKVLKAHKVKWVPQGKPVPKVLRVPKVQQDKMVPVSRLSVRSLPSMTYLLVQTPVTCTL